MTPESKTNSSPAYKTLENLRMRLLDLTARNSLINFRHTRSSSLRVIDELPNQLVKVLLEERQMSFKAVPEPTEEELIEAGYLELDDEKGELVRLRNDPSAEEWARHLGFATDYEMPLEPADAGSGKHADTAIQTLLYPYEMESRLKGLFQSAESAIQEMGANILYLAFGFLEWYDTNDSDKARSAPLFLVPVRLRKGKLNRSRGTYEFTLGYSGEEIIPNLSLREKLRLDFSMALPDLDEETVPEEYFGMVQALVADRQPRWGVRRHISLVLLNFSKQLMYLDLDPARWPEDASIVNHPIASHFLAGHRQEGDGGGVAGFGEEYSIDELDDLHERYPLIDDADSSQHSALIDALDGKNLVVEGPPGTGKSQTITNLIAAAMAQGKKVLFVAEKMAALEVVRSRLDRAGLGEFCLELHSHKSCKRRVLDGVEERLKKHGRYRKPVEIEADIQRYEELKKKLTDYAERVNRAWKKTGKSPHDIFTAATRYRLSAGVDPVAFHPQGYDGDNYDAATRRRVEDQVEAFRKVYRSLGNQLGAGADLRRHPWHGVRNGELQLFDMDRVTGSLGRWQEALHLLNQRCTEVAGRVGPGWARMAETVSGARLMLEELERIPPLKGDEMSDLLPTLRGDRLQEARRSLELFEEIEGLYASLREDCGWDALQKMPDLERLLGGARHLQELVAGGTEMGALARATKRLRVLEKRLTQLDRLLRKMSSALGERAARHLTMSASGITEFLTAVEMIVALEPSCWRHRSEIFDCDELDELLPSMRFELEELWALRDSLKGHFSLQSVPDEGEIRQVAGVLSSGGMLRWFRREWRAARRWLRERAANSMVSHAEMIPLLDDLALFSGRLRSFEENGRYRSALGEHLRGLETDLPVLESLRSWYRQVRSRYGVGFGERVALGDAILALSPETAMAVRSLDERGILKQVRQLLRELEGLRGIFTPVAELSNGSAMLLGEQGVIPRLLSSVERAVSTCAPLLEEDSLTVDGFIERVGRLQQLKERIDAWEEGEPGGALFQGRLGLRPGADNETALSALRNTIQFATAIERELGDDELAEHIYHNPGESTITALAADAEQLREVLDSQQRAYGDFVDGVHLDRGAWSDSCGDEIAALLERNRKALDHPQALQGWLDYMRVREQLAGMGLGVVATAVEGGEIAIEQAEDACRAGIYDLLAREILRHDPELAHFSGHSQQALRDKFNEYDIRLKRLQCELIAWKIDQVEIPAGSMAARVSERTEKALLEHECSKKKRHIPIRQLLQRAGRALQAIKPCFMMSPMSVAQYLVPGRIDFDLVVMDEASQIKPQDALGAIARGRQLVVVGDPKQLPPTSFFDRMAVEDEEDPAAIEESESILDVTLPMFPARRLRWHYRSRHESLIAFSNHSFYDSDLVLFPSPHKQNDDYGIRYHRVPQGCFVNRRNLEEARVVSEAVLEHSRCHPEESVGVVAMSSEQRLQIERAIETLAKEDPIFQKWLEKSAAQQEPLFVKNLENVQGDERDVILISMTYGPREPGGKVFQRFGPINSGVGWRRLNVLLTRSRKRMQIYSSLRPEDVVIGPGSSRGIRALREFLTYCETGRLHKIELQTEREPDSDFEVAVADALRNEGFQCVPQVGVAGFFIDIAVVDPGNPGRYLMGIECDGATYHSAKSARDRDRLRQSILEQLGWRIRRIWSTDWFRNPQAELAPIIRELHDLKSPPAVHAPEKGIHEVVVEERVPEGPVAGGEENSPTSLPFGESSLRDRLLQLDRELIRKGLPQTPPNRRLLRPAMIEALQEFTPTCKAEFLELIPSYLRQGTEAAEGRYLERVFDIINRHLEEEMVKS